MDKIKKTTKIYKILNIDRAFIDTFDSLGINNINKYKNFTIESLVDLEKLDIENTLNVLNTELKEIKKGFKYQVIDWAKTITLAVLFAFIITNLIIINAVIPSGSMENTINIGDRIVAFRLAYILDEPERGDIIILNAPDGEDKMYVKRVIGLPGETLNIIDGKVFINNSEVPLQEYYLKEKMNGSFGPYKIPTNSYFVMGDNRNNSGDSREWKSTFVKSEDILGKALFRYYPSIQLLN